MYPVIRTLKDFESTHATDTMLTTKHGKERYEERVVGIIKKGKGKLVLGFLVDEDGETMEHFVTSVGIVFVRNHFTRKLVTVVAPSASQLSSYYEQIGKKAPKKLLNEATENKRLVRIAEKEKAKAKAKKRAARY